MDRPHDKVLKVIFGLSHGETPGKRTVETRYDRVKRALRVVPVDLPVGPHIGVRRLVFEASDFDKHIFDRRDRKDIGVQDVVDLMAQSAREPEVETCCRNVMTMRRVVEGRGGDLEMGPARADKNKIDVIPAVQQSDLLTQDLWRWRSPVEKGCASEAGEEEDNQISADP